MSKESKPQQLKYQIPAYVEPHIEAGLLQTAGGILVGGVVGLVLFRSGSGYRGASMAVGGGFGVGGMVERIWEESQRQKK